MFELPDYQLIAKGKYYSNHRGLLLYVHNDYSWEPITIKEDTTGWENFFIKIKHKSPGSKVNIIEIRKKEILFNIICVITISI